jgi:hypothetical protein
MKRFLVFLVCFFVFLGSLTTLVHAEPTSRPIPERTNSWVEIGEIISADVFISDPSCNNRGEKLHDDSEHTYCVIQVNQRTYFEFLYGGTVWKNTTVENVENDIKRFHSSWTRDMTCTVWPRGSSGGNYPQQPSGDTDWPAHQWKQLLINQFLVVPSGTTYYNFTSQGTNTNQIVTIKNTTLITTATVWIWTTVNSKLYNYDPNYEKITLSPGTNTQPQQEEQGWIYSSIPAYGFSTGWVEIEINGSFVDFKQSCLNPLVVENNSGNSIRIRYKQTTTSDPYYKRQLVSIYGSGNSLQSIKTAYANEVGVTVSQLSVRKIFPN